MATRPYHLWHENDKAALRWRYYVHLDHAKINGMVQAKQARVGVTIAVRNRETGKVFGQYTRTHDSVKFRNERNEYERAAKSKRRRNGVAGKAAEASGARA